MSNEPAVAVPDEALREYLAERRNKQSDTHDIRDECDCPGVILYCKKHGFAG